MTALSRVTTMSTACRLVAVAAATSLLLSISATSVSAATAEPHRPGKASDHVNRASVKAMQQRYPGAQPIPLSSAPMAADARNVGPKGMNGSPPEAPLGAVPAPKTSVGEIEKARTATATTTRNPDGSLTSRQYYSPQFFKVGAEWTPIRTTLIADRNPHDLASQKLAAFEGTSENDALPYLVVAANEWQARFGPSDLPSGMVRVRLGTSQVGFVPVAARRVLPVSSLDEDGKQRVLYSELWPGVDVEYRVYSTEVKENIIIKNRDATSNVAFTVVGATLQAGPEKNGPAFTIRGALDDQFGITPVNLILNHFGLVSDTSTYRQRYENGVLKISVEKAYLRALPDDAFPAVVDPGVYRSYFGSRAGGDYMSFKSDGYVCPSNVCNLYAGELLDSNNVWRAWRGAFRSPYEWFRDPNKHLVSANLHLTMRTNAGFYTGTYDQRWVWAYHAGCLNSFNCVTWQVGGNAGLITTAGDINVTGIYQTLINSGDFGGWLMVVGEETPGYLSYKNFDPDNTFVDFTYYDPPPAPAVASPSSGQTFVDPQASFKLSGAINPNNGDPLEYEFLVSSGPNGAGTLVSSGVVNTLQWTVPDGVLQDGATYYVQARSYDNTGGGFGPWSGTVPFKIDTRTGKDSTQTFDTLGPVSVDLATGNLTTSASSHSSAALGGSLGISLDYNSPVRSRAGLIGQYYANVDRSGSPAMTRLDQAVDFNWDTSTPLFNGPADNFSAQWTGYFVAPEAATYSFGGVHDDSYNVIVNGQTMYSSNGCWPDPCYGGGTMILAAGQVVPITVGYSEWTGGARVHLYVSRNGNPGQIVPKEWLQTGIRPVAPQQGLTGRYYFDDGSHNFATNTALFLQRLDSSLNFNWGDGPPLPNGPTDNFLIRWSGWLTLPATDNYQFGAVSDDGARILVNGNTAYENWADHPAIEGFGPAVSLAQGQTVPITVEYYEHGGGAAFTLKFKGANGIVQHLPPSWLSPKAQILPDGWNLGIDPDGDLSYDRIKILQNSAVLTDSSGSTHEYSWTGGGYKPPVNEDGQLTRNADGTFTLQDVDGRTYLFAADGSLTSVTSAMDDRKPAALKYTYGQSPTRITQITDGVTPDRWAKVFYSGQSECGSAPATFDAAAPTNMLCSVKTDDGRATYFYYRQGQLARIAEPGNQLLDYQYEQLSNGSMRIMAVRDATANDAIAAGVRNDDATVWTQIAYDSIGRVISVTQPAANAGDARIQHTVEYGLGSTKRHVVGMTEPNGFAQKINYDATLRTTQTTDITSVTAVTEWDPIKDLVLSSTDPMGYRSTTIYDDDDRPIHSYGPAPVAFFDSNRLPLPAYVNQVPHGQTGYDEGIVGPAVAWFAYKNNPTSPASGGSLFGAPKRHSTGLIGNGATNTQPNVVDTTWQSDPFPAPSPNPDNIAGWAVSLTAKVRLPESGTYELAIHHTEGARLWLNDVQVINDWDNGLFRSSPTYFLNYVTGQAPLRLRLDHYTKYGTASPTLRLYIQKIGGFGWTTNWSNYLAPGYNLVTSTKSFDTQLGDSVTATNYGPNPELGLAVTSTVDSGGLNLTTSMTYEAQGAPDGFLRQTSKTLPGGGTTGYSHYGGTETRGNPCTTAVEVYRQAGFMKLKTEPDPDGSGPQSARVLETVYDDAGRPVASRAIQDLWTCTTYDARGRVMQTVVPPIGGEAGRTITNNWSVGGNPLSTATGDNHGDIVTTVDLLGRTVAYTDNIGDWTGYGYDALGRLIRIYGDLGEQALIYDNYGRLVEQLLDAVSLARVYYDIYSRVDHVDYPNAGGQKLVFGRDALGSVNTRTYSGTIGGSSGPGPNLITNPSLETAASADPNTPDRWRADYWSDNTPTFTYATSGHSGSRSAKTEVTAYTSGDAKWYFDPVSVTGNTSYTFTDYYRSSIYTNLVVQFTHQDGSHTYSWIGGVNASSTWAQTPSYAFTTPPTANAVSVFHIVEGVGWLMVDDADLHLTDQTSGGSTGVIASDTITRSQSGQILTDIVASGAQNLWYTYNYDKAGRLASANIGPHTYSYGFGVQNASCGSANNMNPNAGKNSNRTSQTVDGATTTYCYDYADRLVSSSDPTSNYAEYDSHGGMTYLGTGTLPLRLCYDSSDRNWCLVSYDSAGNGVAMYYSRDVLGRMQYREKDSISDWNWNLTYENSYGYTGSGDTPDLIRDDYSWAIVEKYVQLPGDVVLTVKPQQSSQASKYLYSLPNIHGDTLLTTDGVGRNSSTGNGPANSFTYDPFGNVLTGSTLPENALHASHGWVGQHEKLTETELLLKPIQMGGRVYLPTVGRFTSSDPVEGGVENSYVYPPDPVNDFDLDGSMSLWRKLAVGAAAVATGVGVAACVAATAGICGGAIAAVAVSGGIAATGGAAAYGAGYGGTKDFSWKHAGLSAAISGVGGAAIAGGGAALNPWVAWKGGELLLGRNTRIAPLGQKGATWSNGSPRPGARLPHYHSRGGGKGLSWHRPWETVFKKFFRK